MKEISETISNKKLLLPVGMLLCVCLLGVFRLGFPITNSSTPPPPTWFTDWLQDPVCKPPCWQMITPGRTTIQETAKLLGEIPGIKITFGPASTFPKRNRLEMEWQFEQPSQAFGRAASDDQGNITTSLSINGSLNTRISSVIGIYGSPSDVFIPDCHIGLCRAELYYMSSGMVIFLDLLKPTLRGHIAISPNADVSGFGFFAPGKKGFDAAYPAYASSFPGRFSSWQGYKKYPIK